MLPAAAYERIPEHVDRQLDLAVDLDFAGLALLVLDLELSELGSQDTFLTESIDQVRERIQTTRQVFVFHSSPLQMRQ